MRQILAFISAVFMFQSVSGQDMKALDFSSVFKKQHVKSQLIYEVYFSGNTAVDTLLTGKLEFDSAGRLIRYEEYFARGKKFSVTTTHYNETGKIAGQQISTMSTGFLPSAIQLQFDKNGRITERTIPSAQGNMWYREKLTYNKEGVLIRTEKWHLSNGAEVAGRTEDFPSTNTRTDESLSDLYDSKGLPILRKKYSPTRGMNFSVLYEYEYY